MNGRPHAALQGAVRRGRCRRSITRVPPGANSLRSVAARARGSMGAGRCRMTWSSAARHLHFEPLMPRKVVLLAILGTLSRKARRPWPSSPGLAEWASGDRQPV